MTAIRDQAEAEAEASDSHPACGTDHSDAGTGAGPDHPVTDPPPNVTDHQPDDVPYDEATTPRSAGSPPAGTQ